jgi:hypothetical protein
MNKGQLCHRMDDYKKFTNKWLERNARIQVTSLQGRQTRRPTSSAFCVPIEDFPDMVQDQGLRDGVIIATSSVASLMSAAGLPTTDYSVVSILLITPSLVHMIYMKY